MKWIYLFVLFMINLPNEQLIFDFKKSSDISDWRIVDDVVMGGRSSGRFSLTKDGHGHFYGEVSLENNGGFSSVRYNFSAISVNNNSQIVLKVKGDGKTYQFRVKPTESTPHSYITEFETNGNWQEIKIPLGEFYPSYRGRKLNLPNFNHSQIEEVALLIANKKNERFSLLINQLSVI